MPVNRGQPRAGLYRIGSGRLLDRPDKLLDFHRVRTELRGQPIQVRLCNLDETRFVDVADDLDADSPELHVRLMLEFQGFSWLDPTDFVRRRLHPFLLRGSEAAPQFVADPDQA